LRRFLEFTWLKQAKTKAVEHFRDASGAHENAGSMAVLHSRWYVPQWSSSK
jgi:hypothetical protein